MPEYDIKPVSLAHLRYLSDDFSIWQHTVGREIDRREGYALDDAARALLAVLEYEGTQELAATYLRFIKKACCDYAEPINFFDAERQPVFTRGTSPDALGECYWALAACVRHGFMVQEAQAVLSFLDPTVQKFEYARSQAYAVIGASCIDHKLAWRFAENLLQMYAANRSDSWEWPEDTLTYANAILPLALLEASECLENPEYRRTGLKMLDFLNATCTDPAGHPMAIGNEGWYARGGTKALYAQQPIDPAYQVLANAAAFRLTGEQKYKDEARRFLTWFWGNNIDEMVMVQEDESVLDGIDEDWVTENRGSENIDCYLLAQAAYSEIDI